jgi:hypothetical protein
MACSSPCCYSAVGLCQRGESVQPPLPVGSTLKFVWIIEGSLIGYVNTGATVADAHGSYGIYLGEVDTVIQRMTIALDAHKLR